MPASLEKQPYLYVELRKSIPQEKRQYNRRIQSCLLKGQFARAVRFVRMYDELFGVSTQVR